MVLIPISQFSVRLLPAVIRAQAVSAVIRKLRSILVRVLIRLRARRFIRLCAVVQWLLLLFPAVPVIQ